MPSALRKRLDNIRERSGIKSREIAQLLSTTPQTVSRWDAGQATPHPKKLDRLLALDWLTEQLAQVYSADEARLWLFSRNPELAGQRPVDLIAEDRVNEVLAVIDVLQSGAYR